MAKRSIVMKILNFGSLNIDYVYSLDHIVMAGETISSKELNIFPGGKGLNQSVALARAGAAVYHAGCVGKDGQLLIDTLSGDGVDMTYLKVVDEKSGHAIIQVSGDGENSIVLYAGANNMISCEQVDDVLSGFSAGDILVLQNEINNLEYIIDKAYEIGMQIIFNCAPIKENVVALDFSKISCVILNEVEMGAIAGCDDFDGGIGALQGKNPDIKIMLTLGKKGCMYADKNIRVSHPIFETSVVDTTAAGDTFTGYFVSEMAKGREVADIIKVASCASAIAVSRHGASVSIPTYDEVMAALNIMKIKE